MKKLNQKGIAGIVEVLIVVIVLGGLGFAGWRVYQRSHKSTSKNSSGSSVSNDDAISAGRSLSNNKCEGSGNKQLSVSPMKAEDFSHIEPYGLMVGGHVTPIDHQYYSPTIFNSPKDKYPVYAMADSKIVDIEVHPTRIRLVFSVTCTLFYYYDLVTSVESGIDKDHLPVDVKAGQLIGHIGGQTLDFAVWDTTKKLTGFIVPEHYEAESWKIYTVDPLNYYTDDLKALSLSKYVRTAEPRSGKIDYDVDGKLIGTWFQEGTNGYAGKDRSKYWDGHLSFAPDHYDPTGFIISVGYLAPASGTAENQFMVSRDSKAFADVSSDTGLVKYDLYKFNYYKSDGSTWNSLDYVNGVTINNKGQSIQGCALVQMTETRKLKFETFMGKNCSQVSSFNSPRVYER